MVLVDTVGLTELIIIFVIALIVFGPERLTEIARNLGTAVREFRRAMSEASEERKRKGLD
ncbi:twin-arginine translocation protein, TatA/E family [Aeropyrum pernix]|uniref:Twin-arginine translocation protein, TatA/E family n=1 Tax=Aeropyrum pernix TaxID=56636 RepID=A0A401H8U0_AERPX|nr:twin-arginine translocase TatA/TatE family subunit [Aeropyrum pernix]GBF08865.1 twin-arginine translocation protein, TatA/E family [Aeropyrum pernix]